MAHDSSASEHGHEQVGHVVPIKLLVGVGSFLIFMTIITVVQAKVPALNFGDANIWLALAIALVKASAVCLYFMHLRWDSPFNAIVLVSSLLFVILFIGFALTDTGEYQPDISEWRVRGNQLMPVER